MLAPADRLLSWLLPAILIAFLGLYVLAIRSGVEPELALIESGAASALLAVVGRAAAAVIAVKPHRPESVDPIRSETAGEAGPPTTDPNPPASEAGGAADEQYEAVSG